MKIPKKAIDDYNRRQALRHPKKTMTQEVAEARRMKAVYGSDGCMKPHINLDHNNIMGYCVEINKANTTFRP